MENKPNPTFQVQLLSKGNTPVYAVVHVVNVNMGEAVLCRTKACIIYCYCITRCMTGEALQSHCRVTAQVHLGKNWSLQVA